MSVILPRILCIESSGSECSVALQEQGQVVVYRHSHQERDHAKVLAPFVEEVLQEAGITAHELDAVAVSEGPGSYTSLRIGVSLAKGLCYATGKPMIAVGTLQSMAWLMRQMLAQHLPSTTVLCPMIDARRLEVYTAMYNMQLQPLTGVTAEVLTPESFIEQLDRGPVVFAGSGAAKFRELCSHSNAVFIDTPISARGLALLAQEAYIESRFVDVAYFEPFYLKDFVAIKAKNKFF